MSTEISNKGQGSPTYSDCRMGGCTNPVRTGNSACDQHGYLFALVVEPEPRANIHPSGPGAGDERISVEPEQPMCAACALMEQGEQIVPAHTCGKACGAQHPYLSIKCDKPTGHSFYHAAPFEGRVKGWENVGDEWIATDVTDTRHEKPEQPTCAEPEQPTPADNQRANTEAYNASRMAGKTTNLAPGEYLRRMAYNDGVGDGRVEGRGDERARIERIIEAEREWFMPKSDERNLCDHLLATIRGGDNA